MISGIKGRIRTENKFLSAVIRTEAHLLTFNYTICLMNAEKIYRLIKIKNISPVSNFSANLVVRVSTLLKSTGNRSGICQDGSQQ